MNDKAIKQEMVTLVPEEMDVRSPYQLLTIITALRSITWISTINASGVPNLAPLLILQRGSWIPANDYVFGLIPGQV